MKRDHPVLYDNPNLQQPHHQPQQDEGGNHIVYNLEFREMQDRLYNRLHSSSIHNDEDEGHESFSSSNNNSKNSNRHIGGGTGGEEGIEMTGYHLLKNINTIKL